MDNYPETPNPFSHDSDSGHSSPQHLSSSRSSIDDKPLPPDPQGYPNLDLYPAVDNESTKPQGYPNVQPYPVKATSPAASSRPSFPHPSAGIKSYYTGPRVKEEACCRLDDELQSGIEIEIIDAVKTSEGGRASFITYVIKTGSHETHHRYTHFDSLHSSLQRLYPVLIIPPIPHKQSLTDYAVKGSSKAKEDATVIGRRLRMLQTFLRRVGSHPILGGEHVFHRFLDGGSSWNEVLHQPPLSLLPKNPLHAPTYNPTSHTGQVVASEDAPESATESDPNQSSTQSSYIAHHLIPNVSAATPLKHPDARFLDSEAFTDKFAHHLQSVMERTNRRVVKRWAERAHGASELGAVVNGLSLDLDIGSRDMGGVVGEGAGMRGVQEAVERFGQAIDAEHMSTALLLQEWERTTTEPLHTYTQYGQIIRQRLSFRHQKHVQYELVQTTLDQQREKLETLEKAEREARRLEEALENGGRTLMGASTVGPVGRLGAGSGTSILTGQSVLGGSVYRDRTGENGEIEREDTARSSVLKKKQGGSYGLLSAVKHSLSGMMDVDPEATRRANIGRTRDNIAQLEDSLQAAAQDLKYASQTLQADLDRFQRQKVADMRDMTIALAEVHREWAKANLKAWEQAKLAIESIEPHPNQPPASKGAQPSSIFNGVRDDSHADMSFSVDRSKTQANLAREELSSNAFTLESPTEENEPTSPRGHPL